MNDTISHLDYFGVSKQSFDEFKIEINKHIRDYLEEGLQFNQKMDEVSIDSNRKIGETLFFYPVTESISSILTKLSQLQTDKI